MSRTDIINYYLSIRNPPTNYLEIGVRNPDANFNHINATVKNGVDPASVCHCDYTMTSDQFFVINDKKYDVIFIDGDHLCEQVYRDVMNSLKSLKIGGIIVMHDCNPPTENHQVVPLNHNGPWNGTVWKAFVKFRMERPDLKMFVIDTDYGVGIVDPTGSQKIFSCKEDIYKYSVFVKYRAEALNLISEMEWTKTR